MAASRLKNSYIKLPPGLENKNILVSELLHMIQYLEGHNNNCMATSAYTVNNFLGNVANCHLYENYHKSGNFRCKIFS